MNSFFGTTGGYATDTLLFAITVLTLALPLAALIAASLFEGPLRQRFGRRELAPAPLLLRRSVRG